jgi:hypothetical protein
MAALLPLFAASVLPSQVRTLVCRFTGAIMDEEKCCPSDRADRSEPQAQLLGENCCLVKTVDLPKLVSERQADTGVPALEQPALIAIATEGPKLANRPAEIQPVGPPPIGPPLRFLKRSFLI